MGDSKKKKKSTNKIPSEKVFEARPSDETNNRDTKKMVKQASFQNIPELTEKRSRIINTSQTNMGMKVTTNDLKDSPSMQQFNYITNVNLSPLTQELTSEMDLFAEVDDAWKWSQIMTSVASALDHDISERRDILYEY
ncbi:hypothetical protein SNEBB_011101 [Seison nebaliae]|nr:hypothetical protein SNEBB_011101 [Seison nebaliae]